MNSTYLVIAAVLVLVIVGAILLGMIFSRRSRTTRLHDQFGPEYDHVVQSIGSERQAQTVLEIRQKHVEELDIQPLTASQRELYLADWADIQSKFVDQPGEAIVAADRLIMEVMQVRAYPVSDFEQRAADLSVTYPGLVSNYRAAREITLKNKRQMAETEELRQAMIYYRSLFDELLQIETDVVKEK